MSKLSGKYLLRDSPPYHANDYKGIIKKGQNKDKNKKYISLPDKNNIFKWVLIDDAKLYQTHDNGNRPFLVIDSGNKVNVYRQKYNFDTDSYDLYKKIFESKYDEIIIGKNSNNPLYSEPFTGNSILLRLKKEYIFIGERIISFQLIDDENIKKYISFMGNNDVPYPYIIGENNTYLILENAIVPNEILNFKEDIYGQYYGHVKSKDNKSIKNRSKNLKFKLIIKRDF